MEHITDKLAIPPELEPLAKEMRKYKTWKEFEKISIVDKDFRPHPEWLVFIDTLEKIPTKELLGRDIGREILTSEKLNEILRPTGKYRFANLKSFWEAACVKEIWRMTRQEFTNIEEGVVELLPIPPGRRERAVIHPSPKKRGYIQWSLIELNPRTGVWEPGSDIQFPDRQALRRHLEVIHRQEVKQAIDEGKSVPQEVLRNYPDLTKKLTTYTQEHVI